MEHEFEILELLGPGHLKTIQRAYHGQRLYVPKRLREDNPLINLIGRDAAKKLSESFPSGVFTITRSLLLRERNSSIIKERRQGIHPDKVAIRYGLTARTVRKICQGETLKPCWPRHFGMRARQFRALGQGQHGKTACAGQST